MRLLKVSALFISPFSRQNIVSTSSPLADHCVDNNVKQFCRQGPPLGHSAACLERTAVIPLCATDVRRSIPEAANQSQHLKSYPVECQDGEASASVHGVKRFLQVNEDPKEWRLLQMGKLLSKFCLDYPGPRAPPCKAPMQRL